MSEDLGTEEVANGVAQITSDTPTKEWKHQSIPGLQYHKLDQPPKIDDASFGAERYTAEHIFNCRVMIAKHLEHQRTLYHNFIDFKKAFNRVCHDDLWKVLIGGIVQRLRITFSSHCAFCDKSTKIGTLVVLYKYRLI